MPAKSGRAQSYKLILAVVWVVSTTVVLGILMARHTVAFRGPDAVGLNEPYQLSPDLSDQRWRMVHLLSTECGCSKSVIRHLLSRKPVENTNELVVLVGDTDERETLNLLHKAGFTAEQVSADRAAERWKIEGVPWFLIFTPEGDVAYSGGYSKSKVSPNVAIEDTKLLAEARTGRMPAALPAFGCAVSARLKKYFSPLSF